MRSWIVIGALAVAALPLAAAPVPHRADTTPDARLKQLFHDSDERDLRLHPLSAIERGDLRYADRLGDFFTDRLDRAERAALDQDLATLKTIDRARLTATDQLAYDVFRQQRELDLRGYAPGIAAIGRALPIDHLDGIQSWYPDFASGKGSAPFKTVADYDSNLARSAQYAAALDRAIGRMRDGMAAGITLPKVAVREVIDELDKLIAMQPQDSPFYAPVTMFPDAVPAADRTRLTSAYDRQLNQAITPAHRRLRDFLDATYLPAARDTIGLGALPGGAAYYRYLVEASTTEPLDPEEVHRLGLAELKRDTAELEAIKARVGFTGTNAAFFDFLRTDKRFQPRSAEAVRAGYAAIARRIDAHIGEQFSLLPKTRIELRPVPAYREKGAAPGSYSAGTPDGSRPGIFYYNTYDLPSRPTWLMEDLYLHEAVPGHHFQISLAQENTALPSFMRFGGNSAYVEGWGLYAEGLGPELGMMTDPYQRVGGLFGDMIRSVRLVVDTGIHAEGWTRDRAIAFELASAPVSPTLATAEVDRYIVNGGQALAYKVGQLTILRLKAKAKAALGARFDPRRFHAVVLDSGALPLPVLEAKVDAWIAARGR